ncbi:MAG: hypothetical protein J6M56_10905, partial [Clostridia bacterium]|nr:hypothetical protein [Clostridia bacterium]
GELIAQKVNPVVLYSIAGVLAALLVAVLAISGVTSAKRKKRMAQAIDTIELSPDVRNHRGVARRRRQQGTKTDARQETQEDAPIVPAAELTEEETAESTTPARDAMRQLEREEGRRRRAAVEVPTDETLRVVPVDQRPEFIAQGKVDDSQTRIFGKLAEEVAQAAAPKAEEAAEVPAVNKVADLFEEAPAIEEQPEAKADQTIRLSRAQIEEIRQQQEPREDKYAGNGKKKDEIKPMKKKGLFSGFGKKKKTGADEDDFVEEDDDDPDDDDLIE